MTPRLTILAMALTATAAHAGPAGYTDFVDLATAFVDMGTPDWTPGCQDLFVRMGELQYTEFERLGHDPGLLSLDPVYRVNDIWTTEASVEAQQVFSAYATAFIRGCF